MSICSEQQVLQHATILKAFKNLNIRVTRGITNKRFQTKLWQLFVTDAVRKFMRFIDILRHKCSNEVDLFKTLDHLVLPLEILLVWHSFMLNPMSFYDNFKRNDFVIFTKYPFPLEKTCRYIKHGEYDGDYNDYDIFVEAKVHEELATSVHDSYRIRFDFEHIVYPIYCPGCETLLCNRNLFMANNHGFADEFFNVEVKCRCTTQLNHKFLRTMKLINDCHNRKDLPGSLKYFKGELTKNQADLNSCNQKIKRFILDNESELRQLQIEAFVAKYKTRFNIWELMLLRDYVEVNLIQYTLPERCDFHEDLVACVIRQGRFIDVLYYEMKILKEKVMTAGIKRYINFFKLISICDHPIIPTIDIDLVWHTHQLNQPSYFNYSKQVTGTIIDHNDKIEDNRINECFKKTCQLYNEKFGKNYTYCKCNYCSKHKTTKLEIKPSLIQQGRNHHVSLHNQIRIPSDLEQFPTGKPLSHDIQFENYDYVTNPAQPANMFNSNHIELYCNGRMIDALDLASSCGGVKSFIKDNPNIANLENNTMNNIHHDDRNFRDVGNDSNTFPWALMTEYQFNHDPNDPNGYHATFTSSSAACATGPSTSSNRRGIGYSTSLGVGIASGAMFM